MNTKHIKKLAKKRYRFILAAAIVAVMYFNNGGLDVAGLGGGFGSGPVVVQDKSIQELIDSVEVYDGENGVLYDRDDWERPARKFDGKSIRNYSLSISDNNMSKNNVFEYLDPYTNDIITDTAVIDYDHIIPLHYVHQQVGDTWTNEQKNEYAFNISNGVNTHRSENRGKGSRGPSQYMPDENQESYAYSWLVIASHYEIPLKSEDMAVIKGVLKNSEGSSIINIYK